MSKYKNKRTMTVNYTCPDINEMDDLVRLMISVAFDIIKDAETIPDHIEDVLTAPYKDVEQAAMKCLGLNVTGIAKDVGWFSTCFLFHSYAIKENKDSSVTVVLGLCKDNATIIKRYLDFHFNDRNEYYDIDDIDFNDLCYCISLYDLMFMRYTDTN